MDALKKSLDTVSSAKKKSAKAAAAKPARSRNANARKYEFFEHCHARALLASRSIASPRRRLRDPRGSAISNSLARAIESARPLASSRISLDLLHQLENRGE